MNKSLVFSADVLRTIQSLPEDERVNIASAIAGQFILGCEIREDLSPMENLIFTMISSSVARDSARYQRTQAER